MTPSLHDDPNGGEPPRDPWADYPAPGDPAPDADSQRRMERRAARTIESRRSSSGNYDDAPQPRQKEKRSRLVAVAVLVAVAIVLAVAMFAGSGGESGDGASETVPFSIVPLTPEYLQEQEGSTETSSSTTSTTVSSSTPASRSPASAAQPLASAAVRGADG